MATLCGVRLRMAKMTRNRAVLTIIGVTGGSGAGKGELCRILSAFGVEIIDADKVAHGVIMPGKPAYREVVNAFGSGILGPKGEIDRKRLGAIVFGNKTSLALLSKIVHKYVCQACEEIFNNTTTPVVAVDAAALTEGGMTGLCDLVVGVFANKQTRIDRIMARDSISREAAESRITSQMSDDELKTHVDIAIENNGSTDELARLAAEKIVIIQAMAADDIPGAYALELEAYPDDPSPIEWYKDGTTNPDAYYFAAFCEGKQVGNCGMYHIKSILPNFCKIGTLTVKTDFRGRGIGGGLIKKMLSTAEKLGLKRTKLEVDTKNFGAIQLYKTFGFQIEELKENFYGDGEDAYIMWRSS